MHKNRFVKFFLLLTTLLAAALACKIDVSTPQADQAAINTAVALTAQAQYIQMTLQAQASPIAPTQALPTLPPPTSPPPTAPPPTLPPPTLPPPTSPPPTVPPPTNTPTDVYAPDPLGPAWSGMAFSSDTCYDLDVLFTASDTSADVCLDDNVVLSPRNGATFSGSAFMSAPTKNQCTSAPLTADPLAPLTDAYLCFRTNQGSYGFFVMRDDQMLSSGYIVFDAYVFP